MITPLKEILQEGNFNKKERELIKKAYLMSKNAHKGQKFDGTKHDYFLHPAYAGYLLAKWKRGYEAVCAGLLHDVVEDCEIALDKIRFIFGHRTAFLVDGMSWERKWNPKEKKYLKDRKGFYEKIMDYSKQDVDVVIVHASDELSKLSDITGKKHKKKGEKPEKTKKRYNWIATIMLPFYKEVGLKRVSESLWDKIKDYFKSKPKSKLLNYINKKDLKKIKNKLMKIRSIEELK